jgi:hypothetical protein
MPIHDWTRVEAGLFHHFHLRWIGSICDALNMGGLPEGLYALAEQVAKGPVPDVLTLNLSEPDEDFTGGLALATMPPKTRFTVRAEEDIYARKANRITIRHKRGEVISILEIVSPGNKSSKHALRAFVEKAATILEQEIHLLVIDLFPPTKRDPHGIHKAIWDEIVDEPFQLPADKPLTLASYSAGIPKTAYVEPVAVGDRLHDMPLFLEPEVYVPTPLEATYEETWRTFPKPLKRLLES